MLALVAVIAFAVSLVVVKVLLARFAHFALDEPNARSLHERPVPRTGGVGVLAGAAVSIGFGAGSLWVPLTLALGLAIVSFFDDWVGLRTALRFVVHLAAASAL